jgi:hypothetical protein
MNEYIKIYSILYTRIYVVVVVVVVVFINNNNKIFTNTCKRKLKKKVKKAF